MHVVAEQRLVGGRWLIDAEIGRGGFGVVYTARHRLTRKLAAVKLIRVPGGASADDAERFAREVAVPEMLGRPPGVCDVFDAGADDDGSLYFAMELLHGFPLAKRLPNIDGFEALSLVVDMLDSLTIAHSHALVHRDLKPENVFVLRKADRGVRTKLLDFGITKSADTRTSAATVIGTADYMSPEHCARGAISPASDVWSVGVMLYEILSGVRPFQAETPIAVLARVLTGKRAPLPRSPHIAPELAGLVERCLAADPSARPADASALRSELEALLARDEISEALGGLRAPSPSPRVAALSSTLPAQPAPAAILPPTVVVPDVDGPTPTPLAKTAVLAPGDAPRPPKRKKRKKGDEDASHPTDGPATVEAEAGVVDEGTRAESDGDEARSLALRAGELLRDPPPWLATLGVALMSAVAGAALWALSCAPDPDATDATSEAIAADAAVASAPPSAVVPPPLGCASGYAFVERGGTGLSSTVVPAFCIEHYETSVGEYRACVDAGACSTPSLTLRMYGASAASLRANREYCTWTQQARDQEALPMNCVTLPEAAAFCAWAGARLPTSAEYERASMPSTGSRYAWGDAAYDGTQANTQGNEDGVVALATRGRYPAGISRFLVHDLEGNVGEWLATVYDGDRSWIGEERRGALEGHTVWRVAGGGFNQPPVARGSYYVQAGDERLPEIGLRCVRSPE